MKAPRFLLYLALITVLVLFLGLANTGSATPGGVASVLRGRALEIVDDRGQVRARITVEEAAPAQDGRSYPGATVLRLLDPHGKIRVKLAADQDGSGLMLADDRQQPGLQVLAKGSGTTLRLSNKDGREHVLKP